VSTSSADTPPRAGGAALRGENFGGGGRLGTVVFPTMSNNAAAGLVLAVLLAAGAVRAEPPPGVGSGRKAPPLEPLPQRKGARLTWVRGVGAEGCVGPNGLEEDVKARLGRDPFALPPQLAIEGAIVRVPGGFRVDLVVRDPEGGLVGTRQLSSRERDCRSLGEAVAVAITVTIEPDTTGARGAAPDRPPAAPAAPAAPRARGSAALAIGAGAGVVPGISPVVSLRTSARVERAEVGVGAQLWPESRAAGMGFALAAMSLDACLLPFASTVAFRWCGALLAGFFHAVVHAPELAPVEVGATPWLGAETGPLVSVPVTGTLRLEAGAAALVPLTRRQAFVRDRPDPAWGQAIVGGRIDLGARAVF